MGWLRSSNCGLFCYQSVIFGRVEVKEATKTICLNAHELSDFKAHLELESNKYAWKYNPNFLSPVGNLWPRHR
jgi:hypothetical protein